MKNYILTLFLLSSFAATAQTLPVGSPVIENYLRRQQLLGKVDSSFSFNYRPITVGKNGLNLSLEDYGLDGFYGQKKNFLKTKGHVRLLSPEVRIQYDNRHPDSRNDGAMIRSKGLQSLLTAGFYAEYGPLSIQFKPEYVVAENLRFPGFSADQYDNVWASRYVFWNQIDSPERFGTATYSKFNWGQSSIRLNKWGLSLGLSTENLWWGPAIRNSIMMSNNAEGFPHLTLNTQRPIKTAIGSFEGQFITGRLEASGFTPPDTTRKARQATLYVPKVDDWRYYQAITMSYSPKWVKGLSLGVTRWVQQYAENAKESKSYFPIFQNLFRQNDIDEFGFNLRQDQAAGIFGRWLWFDSKAEVYFEFAKNDAPINFRDLLTDTDHSRAFTFGINKLFELPKPNRYIQFNAEWTQTSQTESRLIRNSLSWYIHSRVRHGYTNNGEVLGSALGPSGNAFYMEVSWVNGLNRIGGAVERYIHNNDFMHLAYANTLDFTRYWIDYNLHAFADWKFEKILLSGSIYYTRSLNYEWGLLPDPNGNPFLFVPDDKVNNLNLDIKLAYLF